MQKVEMVNNTLARPLEVVIEKHVLMRVSYQNYEQNMLLYNNKLPALRRK